MKISEIGTVYEEIVLLIMIVYIKFHMSLKVIDPVLYGLIDEETHRQNDSLEMIASENFTSESCNTSSIVCKRSINSKNPDAKAREVIIKNY